MTGLTGLFGCARVCKHRLTMSACHKIVLSLISHTPLYLKNKAFSGKPVSNFFVQNVDIYLMTGLTGLFGCARVCKHRLTMSQNSFVTNRNVGYLKNKAFSGKPVSNFFVQNVDIYLMTGLTGLFGCARVCKHRLTMSACHKIVLSLISHTPFYLKNKAFSGKPVSNFFVQNVDIYLMTGLTGLFGCARVCKHRLTMSACHKIVLSPIMLDISKMRHFQENRSRTFLFRMSTST